MIHVRPTMVDLVHKIFIENEGKAIEGFGFMIFMSMISLLKK